MTIIANAGQILPFVILSQWVTGDASLLRLKIEASWIMAAVVAVLVSYVLSLAVSSRRLHDRGKSAWWLVVFYLFPLAAVQVASQVFRGDPPNPAYGYSMLPVLAVVIWGFVEFGVLAGNPGPNRFGADPKGVMAVEVFD